MTLVVGLLAGVVLTPLARATGLLLGIIDRPDREGLKIHRGAVPLTGGLAVVAAIAIALAVVGELPSPWVLGAVGLGLAVGVVDDVRPLPPAVRVIAQVGAGMLLVGAGLRLGPLGALGATGVVALTVATTNAVNLVDGQDALAGSLGAVAALGLASVAAMGGTAEGAALGLATAGALAGFLVWNRPPAKVFLGNGGAYAVGVLLAASAAVVAAEGWQGLLAAALCLGVFAFELIFTVARRVTFRRPMAGGDRAHSYDLVAARTGDRLRTTFVFGGLAVLSSGAAVLVGRAPLPLGAAVVAAIVATAALWARGLWTQVRGEAGAL